MADYLVDTDFRGKDMVTPTLRGMGREVTRFSKESKHSLSTIFKGSFMGTLGAHAVTGGLMAARRGISELASEYMNFDEQINAAAVKFGGIDYGSDKFKEIGDVAREVGRTTKFTTGDAAEGLLEMAGAGFEVQNALKMLPSMANFAAAAKMDLATATTVAGGALNAFAMNSKDAAIQAENLVRISDLLAMTDALTMASMESLGETVSWAAGRFTAAGQSIETFGAISGGLADVKVEGSAAGTVMRNMVKNLTSLGPKGKKALKTLGMGMKDIQQDGNFENMITILEKMEAPLKKLGTHARSKVISDIFGERAVRGVIPLINKGMESVRDLETKLQSAGGASKKMGDQLNQSLTFRVMALQNALLEKGFQVFEKFLGDGNAGIENIIKSINDFDIDPIVSAFKTIGNVTSFIAKNIGTIARVGIVFGTIKAAMSLKNAVMWGDQMRKTLTMMSTTTALDRMPQYGSTARGGIATRGSSRAPKLPAPLLGYHDMTPEGRSKEIMSRGGKHVSQIQTMKVENAANVMFAAAAAGAIGYQIGDAINEYMLEPMRKFSAEMDFNTDNLLTQRKKLLSGKMGEEELRGVRAESKKQIDTSAGAMFSTDTIIGMFGSLFSDTENPIEKHMREQLERGQMFSEAGAQLEKMYDDEKKSMQKQSEFTDQFRVDDFAKEQQDEYIKSITDYTGKQNELSEVTRIFAENIEKTSGELRKMIQNIGGTANVNVKVEGPGADTVSVVSKSSGKNPPSVDVSQSGPN